MARIQDNSRFYRASISNGLNAGGVQTSSLNRSMSAAADAQQGKPEPTIQEFNHSKTLGSGNRIDPRTGMPTTPMSPMPTAVNGVAIDPRTGIPKNPMFTNQLPLDADGNSIDPQTTMQMGDMMPMYPMQQSSGVTNSNSIDPMTGLSMTAQDSSAVPQMASSFPMSGSNVSGLLTQMMTMMQSLIGMMMQLLQGATGNTTSTPATPTGNTAEPTTTAGTPTAAGSTGTGTTGNVTEPVVPTTTETRATTADAGTTNADGTTPGTIGNVTEPVVPTNANTDTTAVGKTSADATNNNKNNNCNNTGNTTTGGTTGTTTGTTGNTTTGTGSADGTTDDGTLTPAERAAKAAANPGAAVDPSADVDRSKNFHNESTTERTANGLDDHDRAIIHLWGRQIISAGKQDGGILLNVEGNVDHTFTPEEHTVADQLIAQDKQDYGGITGKSLDKEFFKVMQKLHPDTTINTAKWLDTPVNFATGPVNMVADEATLTKQTGLSQFDQGVLRLWGHDPLMNGGKIDGSVLAYTIGNPNALDNAANAGNGKDPGNIDIDNIAQGLLNADLTQDGVRNGDSLSFAFGRVLDKVYLGKTDDNMAVVQKNADTKAAAVGRTPAQIAKDVTKGVKQAAADTAQIIKEHPFLSAGAIAGAAAAGAICPFLGGLAVGGAGIAAGQKLLSGNKKSTDSSTVSAS